MKFRPEIPSELPNLFESKEGLPPRRVFVDIGSGIFPVAFAGNREFKDSDYYVGVEIDRARIERGLSVGSVILNNPENVSRIGQHIFFIEKSVTDLPFPDASIDEVYLGNILGECMIDDINPFLEQAHRILKPDGTLIILETRTPNIAADRKKQGVCSLIESFGFTKTKEFKKGGPELEAEIAKFAQHEVSHLREDAFIAYFVKN